MSECTHDCGSCSSACAQKEPESLLEALHEKSRVDKVIGIVSGKGGVGKSLVTSMLAVEMKRKGYGTAVLDADITGPSIPKAFGITEKADGDDTGLLPVTTDSGIQIMSTNLLLANDTDPVVWRGPVIAGAVKQFWTDVIWSEVDYMFVDMPPGTGDVPLTVFQSIPVNGIIIVTSPQELVSMVVEKAVKMAQLMDVPILGIVENYSYLSCPDCGKKLNVFGESRVEKIAGEYGLKVLAKLPIDPALAKCCDEGKIEEFAGDYLKDAANDIESL